MRDCFSQAVERDPAAEGLVVTELAIDEEGHTEWTDTHNEGTTITDKEMLACVERIFGCLSHAPSGKPGKVFVHYPIRFETHE